MNSQEALAFINRLLAEKRKQVLNELQEKLFLGIWKDQTFLNIAAQSSHSEQYLREASINLYTKIREELGIKVSKKNFKNPIEYVSEQYSEKALLSQKLIVEPNNPAQGDESQSDYLSQQNHNPFTPLNDIISDQHLLHGREREITRIFETLNSGSSVALIGEKKIGKSSLLQAIYQQAQARLIKPRKAIYLNLSLIFNDDDFYDDLCEQVNIRVQKGRELIRNLQKQQLLLLLDEVEQMTWKGFTRDLRQQLRGLADGQANPPLRLVITASEHLDILFPDSRENPSPFQGVCIEEIIHPWDENIVRRFIHNRLMNTQISFTEEEIIELIKESCGHPQRLMYSCHRIYSLYIQRMKTEL